MHTVVTLSGQPRPGAIRGLIETNRELWDGWTEPHVPSKFYDVQGFKAGRETPLMFSVTAFKPEGTA